MSKKQSKRRTALSEKIQHSIETANVTRYRSGKDAGIDQSVLCRFALVEPELLFDALDNLDA